MKLRMIGAACVLALATLSLTACGGGGDDEKASKAISDSLMTENTEEFQLDQGEADCIGDGLVDKLGVDKLKEYGVVTDDLESSNGIDDTDTKMNEEDASSAADVFLGCGDMQEMFSGMMSSASPDEKVQACLEDAFTEDLMHEFLTAVFMQDAAKGQELLTKPMMDCMSG